jgi:exodeoxyribonuclease VII small subunit
MPDENDADQFAASPVTELTYEQAFLQLEEIVAVLEGSDYPLERTIELYERGQELAKYCTERLEQANLRLKKLTEDGLADFTITE